MLNSKVLSLEIGSKYTKIVLGSQSKKNVIVDKAITIPTPVGSYNDGNILNTTKFESEILQVLKEENIKCKNIIITTKSTSIITRDIDIPIAKKEDMDAIVKFQMERYLPINFENYIIQYNILEEFKEENIKQAKITVVMYPKIMAEGYFNLIKLLKCNAVALDISSNSINKLFIEEVKVNNEDYSLEDTVAVIDLGYDFINVDIISNGNVQFTRVINHAGANIDVEVAKQLSISEEEAEKQKLEGCNLGVDFLSDTKGSMVNDIAKAQVRNWISEIERLLDYYKSTEQGNKIDKMYIYGGSSNLKGIEVLMKDLLNLSVIKIQSLSNVNCSKIDKSVELSKYLNAIGAIIRLG